MGLIVVSLAGVAVRAYLIATTEIVARDGITFVKYAQGLRSDPIGEMRGQAQHPLYPTTVLVVHSLIGPVLASDPVFSWPLAGQIASLVGGMLAVWAAYALGRIMWDQRIGLITALFAALLPELCQVSGDALSDGLHLGLYLWGLALLLRARQGNRLRCAAAAALFSAAAFLVRPEGGSILAIGLVAILTARRDWGWSWRRRVAGVTVMLVCFAVLAGPYMITVGRVIKKKNIFELFGLNDWTETAAAPLPRRPDPARDSPARVANGPGAVLDGPGPLDGVRTFNADPPVRAALPVPIPVWLLYYWARACRVVYLILGLPALAMWVSGRPRGRGPVVLAFLLHMGLLYALYSSFGYLSLRHLLVPAALTLPFAAATFGWLVDQASIRLGSRHHRRARVVRPLAYLVGIAAVVGPTTPWMLRTIGPGSGFLMKAGRWLHAHSQPGDLVLTTRNRAAYYAELPMALAPDSGSVDELARSIDQQKPDYVVIERAHETVSHRNPNFFADLAASPLRHRLELIHEEAPAEPNRRARVFIYRVRASTASQSAGSRPTAR